MKFVRGAPKRAQLFRDPFEVRYKGKLAPTKCRIQAIVAAWMFYPTLLSTLWSEPSTKLRKAMDAERAMVPWPEFDSDALCPRKVEAMKYYEFIEYSFMCYAIRESRFFSDYRADIPLDRQNHGPFVSDVAIELSYSDRYTRLKSDSLGHVLRVEYPNELEWIARGIAEVCNSFDGLDCRDPDFCVKCCAPAVKLNSTESWEIYEGADADPWLEHPRSWQRLPRR